MQIPSRPQIHVLSTAVAGHNAEEHEQKQRSLTGWLGSRQFQIPDSLELSLKSSMTCKSACAQGESTKEAGLLLIYGLFARLKHCPD